MQSAASQWQLSPGRQGWVAAEPGLLYNWNFGINGLDLGFGLELFVPLGLFWNCAFGLWVLRALGQLEFCAFLGGTQTAAWTSHHITSLHFTTSSSQHHHQYKLAHHHHHHPPFSCYIFFAELFSCVTLLHWLAHLYSSLSFLPLL